MTKQHRNPTDIASNINTSSHRGNHLDSSSSLKNEMNNFIDSINMDNKTINELMDNEPLYQDKDEYMIYKKQNDEIKSNYQRPISVFERDGKIVSVYHRKPKNNKKINKSNLFQRLSSEYLKEARALGYNWSQLINKNTRDIIINEILLNRANIKKEQYYEKYPKIKMSVKDARYHEMSLSTDNNRNKYLFIQLFESRLATMKGPMYDASLTLNTSITNTDTTIDKNYGPFITRMPSLLSNEDKYKYALYILLKSNVNMLSGEFISELGFDIMKLEKRDIVHHKMGSVKLENYLLQHQRPIKSQGKDLCVIDYVFDTIKDKRGFKRYDYNRLRDEINKYVLDGPRISTYELIQWANERHPNTVSIHAFDCRYKRFIQHISSDTRVSLVFIAKDGHCYPILDKRLKEAAIFSNGENLLKYMTTIKWSMRHDKITKLNDINDIIDTEINDSILILPPDTKIDQAINQYMISSKCYVELFKYNNNGMLDVFIDNRNNMIVLDNDYDQRKDICNKLYGIYKSDDFVWCNQSFTSIAIDLFKQLCGQVDESSYNTYSRSIIDSFYPRALLWSNTEFEIPDKDIPNIKSIDISKAYPSILLNNKSLIPVYTIHDEIKAFDYEKDKICNHGEYYIDEYILALYGANITIEAAFYSSDLINFLLSLGMPRNQIKYKFEARRCLKPNTYSRFIKYIFDHFDEAIAKKLANSYIGQLGKRFKKIDRGFISTDYDTVLCCWSRAMAEGKSLSINKCNDNYLLREQRCERLFQDNTSINRFIISQSILKTLKLIYKCCDEQSKLIYINTDGFQVLNPFVEFEHKKNVKFDTSCIGKAYMTDPNISYIERHYRDNIDIKEFKSINGKGMLYLGAPGTGKTRALCNMVMNCKDPLILSFTNKGIQNVIARLISDGYNDAKKYAIHTTVILLQMELIR